MSESPSGLHEPATGLSDEVRDFHRALASLREELEAVDGYRQRAHACRDQPLRQVLEHNMGEEMEHAAMLLAWLRRRDPGLSEQLKAHLGTNGPITGTEARVESVDKPAPPAEADAQEPAEGETDSLPGLGISDKAFTVGPLKEGI